MNSLIEKKVLQSKDTKNEEETNQNCRRRFGTIIVESKYHLLKQDKQEKRKEEEKSDLNFVNTNKGTPGVKRSANKDKRSMFKDGTMDNKQAEGYIHAGKKNIAKPGDIVDSSQ